MAIISTYPIDASVSLEDKLIGTDTEDLDKTMNYTVDSILQLLASASLTIPTFATNAAALAGGLTAGRLYKNAGDGTSSSLLAIVY
jgi:hypothetical protein